MNKTYNSTDRNALEKFLGQQINFNGLVVDTKSPTPHQKFICLRKMSIASHGEEVKCHHMWLDISHLKDLKVRLCQWIQGVAYVEHYYRRDGSESYGITAPSGMTAVAV